MPNVDICCACGIELPDPETHEHVKFWYRVPESQTEALLIATVCPDCKADSEDKKKADAVDALINARIIRLDNPDKVWTPKGWNDN